MELNEASVMDGKTALVIGVANQRSIAWGIAEALAASGMEVGLTYQHERLRDNVEVLADAVGARFVVPCDVTDEGQIDALMATADATWGRLDSLVHSVAYARPEDLEGDFLDTSRDGFLAAHEIGAFSLTRLCRGAVPLMRDGGSVVTLSYIGSERAMPGYNVMGAAKASLEASARYLANELGPRGVRVNVISAGPVKTLAAFGVPGFSTLLKYVRERVPLRRNVTQAEIAAAARFLLSSAASGITGEVIHVDAGFHAVAS